MTYEGKNGRNFNKVPNYRECMNRSFVLITRFSTKFTFVRCHFLFLLKLQTYFKSYFMRNEKKRHPVKIHAYILHKKNTYFTELVTRGHFILNVNCSPAHQVSVKGGYLEVCCRLYKGVNAGDDAVQ